MKILVVLLIEQECPLFGTERQARLRSTCKRRNAKPIVREYPIEKSQDGILFIIFQVYAWL